MSNQTLAVKFTNLHSADSKYFISLRNTDFEGMRKQMNCVEMSSIFYQTLGPLVLGWAPNQ